MSVTVTVGTNSRQYSTVASALSLGVPTNISSSGANTPYILSLYNDSEFYTTTSSNFINVTGITTDATNTLTITAAAGQSFMDNASVQTNALKYNQANGVGIRINAGYSVLLESVNVPNVIVTRLQMSCTTSGGSGYGIETDNNTYISNCILEYSNTTGAAAYHPGSNQGIENCLIIVSSTGSRGITAAYDNCKIVNCTIVVPSDVTNTNYGIAGSSETWTVINTAVFGFGTNFYTASGTYSGCKNNCSDQAISFGTNNQASKTYANQFHGITTSTKDYRLKSGADCIDNGYADSADVPNFSGISGASGTSNISGTGDIAGTSRPQGSAWDIGAWELFVASGNFTATVTDSNSSSDTVSIILYPVTPASDITTAGWTATPSGSFFNTLNEVTENDSNYITSPATPTSNNITMGLSATLPAGSWTMNLAGYYTGTSGQVRAHLQNGSAVDQGVSSWVTLSGSVTAYQVLITTTGPSTQIMLEVQ